MFYFPDRYCILINSVTHLTRPNYFSFVCFSLLCNMLKSFPARLKCFFRVYLPSMFFKPRRNIKAFLVSEKSRHTSFVKCLWTIEHLLSIFFWQYCKRWKRWLNLVVRSIMCQNNLPNQQKIVVPSNQKLFLTVHKL